MNFTRKLGTASVLAAAWYAGAATAADYNTQIYSVTVDEQNGILKIDGVDLAPAGAPTGAHVQLLGHALEIHDTDSSSTHLEAALPESVSLNPGTGYQLYVSPSRSRGTTGLSVADQAFFTLYVASKLSGAKTAAASSGPSGGASANRSVSGSGTGKTSTNFFNSLGSALSLNNHSSTSNVSSTPSPSDGPTFTLPYTGSFSSPGSLFSMTNTGTGDAITGTNSSTSASVVGVRGVISSTAPGASSVGVYGINNATTANGFGVWGAHHGTGTGVLGTSTSGYGVQGFSPSGRGLQGYSSGAGIGVFAQSTTGTSLYVTGGSGPLALLTNTSSSNKSDLVSIPNAGTGRNLVISNSNTNSAANVVAVATAGTGEGLDISNSNNNNTTNILNVVTNGPGVIADHTKGNAANFFVNNTSGVGAGVRGETNSIFGNNGTAGVYGSASGTGGYGGYFDHTNSTGFGMALYGTTQGQGMVAEFVTPLGAGGTNNNGNSQPTVLIQQTANGSGLSISSTSPTGSGTTPNTSNILNVTFDGPGVIADHSQGNAGNFFVNNTTSVAAGVRGETNSIFGNEGTAGVYGVASGTGGYAGYFHHTDTTGFGIGVQVQTEDQGTALVVNQDNSSTGDPAIFQNQGFNVARIDRNGKGFFNGGTQNSGADLAEFVPTIGATPQVGDVVEIDPEHPNSFRLCAEANTTRVAGIISTAPGVTLNAKDSATAEVSGPALALAGRVPTKVNKQNGAIHIGDLLVASSQPGHAMRAPAHPEPGTVIGKALQDSDADQGTVEVLVMLR